MNGSLQMMYSIKPVFSTDSEFTFNSPMYGMKNLLSVESNNIPDDQFKDIEERQRVLLNHINDIKIHLSTLRAMLLERSKGTCQKSIEAKNIIETVNIKQCGVIHEIVVNANIQKPPYSLLALPVLLGDSASLEVTSHYHSSVSCKGKETSLFDSFKTVTKSSNCLKIRLIWRKGETEVVLGRQPLMGEVPLLRFIHKVLCASQNAATESLVQSKLDDCHNSGPLSIQPTDFSQQWMVANSFSVVDIAVWSAIKNLSQPPNNKAVLDWFNKIDSFIKEKIQ